MSLVKKIAFIFLATLLPLVVFAVDFRANSGVRMGATVFSVINIILLVTSIVSIRQFFWPGYENRLPFHVFNIVFSILFYCISLAFLIANQHYYVGYEHLPPIGVLAKFFFSADISSISQWVIIIAVVCNIIYVIRNYKDYFQAGLVRDAGDENVFVDERELVETDADAIP
ncbi:MAG: hypothetical protein KF744_00535 [Taibaiella sp.]|nr:hypothetical protein [Taibaiella sp.]